MKCVSKRPLVLLVAFAVTTAFVAPCSAQDADAAAPRVIHIYPPAERAEDSLEEFLSSGAYDAQTDATLTVALADELVRSNELDRAKRTVDDALRRNRRHGEDLLVGAFLHDTMANIEARRGDLSEQRENRYGAYRRLKEHFGDAHPAVGLAKLRYANAILAESPERPTKIDVEGFQTAQFRWVARARSMLVEVKESAALKQGESHPLTLLAMINIAELDLHQGDLTEASEELETLIAKLNGLDDTNDGFRFRALALRIRLEHARGETAAVDRTFAELLNLTIDAPEPILVLEFDHHEVLKEMVGVPYQQVIFYSAKAKGSTHSRLSGSWADVGFCVTGEGGVEIVEIADFGGRTSWHDDLLGAVAQRRYYPRTTAGAFDDCAYQLQRFTVASGTTTRSESRIRHKSPNTYLFIEDLKSESPASSPLFAGQ